MVFRSAILRRRALVALLFALGAGLVGCGRKHETGAPASSSASRPSASGRGAVAPVASGAETDTISHASESYSAGPPVTARTHVDGRELRKRHSARLRADRTPVTVLRGESALELGQRICEAVVPKRAPHTEILLKPNLCGFDGIKDPPKNGDDGVNGRITDAEFVRGVVRCLKARGHDRITIAEGCGLSHQHFLDTIRVSGYAAMAEQERVPLVALDDDGIFDVEGSQPGKPLAVDGIADTHVPTLLLPKLLADTLQNGLFISVPKLKAHRYAVVSLGIKGMQGTVMRSDASPAYNQKWRMHAELKDYLRALKRHEPEDRAEYVRTLELFAERMVDVLELSLPDVILVDGAPAMAGDGFQNLRKVPGYVALGGTNPILVDRLGAEYLGLYDNAELGATLAGHRTSPLIELAARRYGVDLGKPPLTGDGVALLSEPRPVFFKAIAPFTLEGRRIITPPPPKASAAPPHDAPAPSAGVARDARPIAHAAHTASAPVLDGKIDAPWASAAAATFSTDYRGEDSGISTRVRFLWSQQALYVLFELAQSGFNTDTSFPVARERPKLYGEDCVELFLTPEPSRRSHYFEIELGPFGHFFDLEVDREKHSENVEWSSQVSLSTARDREHGSAVIEARITAPEIVSALRAGARLPLALYRMEGREPRHYLAWSPPRTAKPNFHVPEAFGLLALDP